MSTLPHRNVWVLCLLATGCTGDRAIVGSYESSDGGSSSGHEPPTSAEGSSTDGAPSCDGPCDPDFAIAYLGAPNGGFETIALFATADGTCEGERCPTDVGSPTLQGEPVVPCHESAAAMASPLGVEEHCRLSPLVSAFGISFGFVTPVDRESVEKVGPPLHTEASPEPYLWHTDVVAIEGPGTAHRDLVTGIGDAFVEESQNLTCIDRLAALGVSWTPETLASECAKTWNDGGAIRPRSMAPSMVFHPTRGQNDYGALSCSGTDCCDHCDHLLTVGVARYGGTADGVPRDPGAGTAIACDPEGDVLVDCRDFIPAVDRSLEMRTYEYAWDAGVESWVLPLLDKLRETHPSDRPPGLDPVAGSCDAADDCSDGLDCIEGECRLPWLVSCVADLDVTGPTGYCADRRFDRAAGANCHVATVDFANGQAGERMTSCDPELDGMSAQDCCDPALGGGDVCDPALQPGVDPVPRYDRDPELVGGECVCDEASAADPACADAVATWCASPLGSPDPALVPTIEGQWAIRPATTRGGVRYDEELAELEIRIADFGTTPRAAAEACAEGRGLIGGRTPLEERNQEFLGERIADHDLSMCSGSTYRITFAASDAAQHVRSAADGTLDGRAVHVFETSQFRIVPNSAFPTDELDIGACGDLGFRVSNDYDLAPQNLAKLELRDEEGATIAGGPGCSPTATPEQVAAGAVPCLAIDISEHLTGGITVAIDDEVHGQVLQPGARYDIVVPGLPDIAAMADPVAYAAAFHDACGMPLILGDSEDVIALSRVSFEIDRACE